jgi:hypothetical protein
VNAYICRGVWAAHMALKERVKSSLVNEKGVGPIPCGAPDPLHAMKRAHFGAMAVDRERCGGHGRFAAHVGHSDDLAERR